MVPVLRSGAGGRGWGEGGREMERWKLGVGEKTLGGQIASFFILFVRRVILVKYISYINRSY